MPDQALLARHAFRCSVIPDRYAHEARVGICIQLVAAEIKACREVIAAAGEWTSLPKLGGWHLFAIAGADR